MTVAAGREIKVVIKHKCKLHPMQEVCTIDASSLGCESTATLLIFPFLALLLRLLSELPIELSSMGIGVQLFFASKLVRSETSGVLWDIEGTWWDAWHLEKSFGSEQVAGIWQ